MTLRAVNRVVAAILPEKRVPTVHTPTGLAQLGPSA